MPLQTQAKILRVLTDQSFTRVGNDELISIDSRIICSSTKDLNNLTDSGNFRKDLFHRLNVVNIKIPNLNERIEDIDLIIDHFSKYYSELNSVKNVDLKPLIRSKYLNYEWPGNIRELRNLVERYIIIGDKFDESKSDNKDIKYEQKNVISMPLKNARRIFEKNYLQSQIKRFNGNISKTASFIGMERSALHRKLKQLGLNEEEK
jgi:two-component system nitrogen regulation response regulator NtrX